MPHARVRKIPRKDRRAFSFAEVSAMTGFAISSLYKWMAEGRLKTRKVAGRRIMTPENLDELLRGDGE
jgi:predicted DNA-binding transcriptional regulator AlpA